jgi:hypothetical protein
MSPGVMLAGEPDNVQRPAIVIVMRLAIGAALLARHTNKLARANGFG